MRAAVAYLERWYDRPGVSWTDTRDLMEWAADELGTPYHLYSRQMFEEFDDHIYRTACDEEGDAEDHAYCTKGAFHGKSLDPLTDDALDLFIQHGSWVLVMLEDKSVKEVIALLAENK